MCLMTLILLLLLAKIIGALDKDNAKKAKKAKTLKLFEYPSPSTLILLRANKEQANTVVDKRLPKRINRIDFPLFDNFFLFFIAIIL